MTRLALMAALLLSAGAAHAEQIRLSPGQPVCSDQDSLQAFMTASLAHNPKALDGPCEFAKAGATAEILERYPSGTAAMRVVKVSVRAPGRAPMVGYTIEITPR